MFDGGWETILDEQVCPPIGDAENGRSQRFRHFVYNRWLEGGRDILRNMHNWPSSSSSS